MSSTINKDENFNLSPDKYKKLVDSICNDLNGEDYKRPPKNEKEHFENGPFLHSCQYYFAKKYFQSSNNCDNLALLLANKIIQLNIENVTLIGFRSYIGLLLSKTKKILDSQNRDINYAIIEPKKDN